MTTEKKVTTPRAPRTKKVVSAPVTAVEAVQEVVAEQPVKVIPDAVKAAPNVVAGSIPLVATLNCQVCKQAKEKKTFVVQSKKAGFDTPEEGVMCKECHEDLVALQTANGGKAGHYKNLMESRNWDKNAYKTAKLIKEEAGREETRLRCFGTPEDPCSLYHGQYIRGKYKDENGETKTKKDPEVQVITTRKFLKSSIDLAKKELEPIPLPKGACEFHSDIFTQQAREANPEEKIFFVRGLESFDLIESINNWRKSEKVRIEEAKEAKRLQTLANQEAYRSELRADSNYYIAPQNDRPATKRQNDRHSLEGKFNSKEHDENEDRRHR